MVKNCKTIFPLVIRPEILEDSLQVNLILNLVQKQDICSNLREISKLIFKKSRMAQKVLHTLLNVLLSFMFHC